jgi:hypothetical protein
LLVVNLLTLGSSASSIPFVNPGLYTQSTVNIFESDVVYRGGFEETYYVKEEYVGTIVFNFPCSQSGSTPISHSIVAHPSTGTFPAWVSINPDYEHLNVVVPSYGLTNDYYFAVRSIILGENVDKLVTLTVYE